MYDPDAVARICDAISRGSPDEAAALARAELPLEAINREKRPPRNAEKRPPTDPEKCRPTDAKKRPPTDDEKVSVFLRDCFIDRYSGERLVFPGTLRLLSQLLPKEIPYHPRWKSPECHMLYWHLFPTVDHVDPVARGGPGTIGNLVCTSMLKNNEKGKWRPEELGWRLHQPGSLHAWDGLLGWFMTHTSDDESVLEQQFIKDWHSAAEQALKDYEPQEDLPSGLRSHSRN